MDEDVAAEAARCLQQAGHEVLLVAEVLGVRTDDVDRRLRRDLLGHEVESVRLIDGPAEH